MLGERSQNHELVLAASLFHTHINTYTLSFPLFAALSISFSLTCIRYMSLFLSYTHSQSVSLSLCPYFSLSSSLSFSDMQHFDTYLFDTIVGKSPGKVEKTGHP